MSTLARRFQDLISAIRVADVIDIVIVAFFTYAVISWVRRARSRFVLLGFATLVALYFLARVLDMYLTLFLFQAGITVALLALIVIFQEEIRRAFERIATGGLLRAGRAQTASTRELLAPIVEATTGMARGRTGALIVLRGKEPLERHTSGGVALGGQLSAPLLYSIFDPHSAGHDGAVIIERGVVSKFAVHLPLSSQTLEGAHRGTRHSAALGVSERSDALAIVVSEERGSISVAQGGTLDELRSPAALEGRLLAFIDSVTPVTQSRPWRRLIVRNPGTKALSAAIAVSAWLLLFGQQSETVARTFSIPVVFRDVPDGWLLDEPTPLEARVTLSGKSRAFELIEPSALRLSLEGASIRAGKQTVKLAPNQLDLPPGLTVHEIDPDSVTYVAHETVAKELPIRALLVGQLRGGLTIKSANVIPPRVRVMVARADRGRLSTLRTEPIELDEITASTTVRRGVVVPRGSRLARGEPTEVQVAIEVEVAPPR